jgi:pyrroline-5-carboxylate reductase
MSQWPRSLTLVGAGKMGRALLDGWLAAGLEGTAVTIVDPAPAADLVALCQQRGIARRAPTAAPEALVLAVKPQIFATAAAGLPVDRGTLVVSIMAGKTLANIRESFPTAGSIVRAMPNTPASVGRGVTAGFAERALGGAQKAWTETLFKAVGGFHWLEEEKLIDAVTAISGSGPAYVFALVEALARSGVALGLPEETARGLARATIEGAGELLYREPEISPTTLRQNVTSPGGTTAAALAVLQSERGLDALIRETTGAAFRRAGELAG